MVYEVVVDPVIGQRQVAVKRPVLLVPQIVCRQHLVHQHVDLGSSGRTLLEDLEALRGAAHRDPDDGGTRAFAAVLGYVDPQRCGAFVSRGGQHLAPVGVVALRAPLSAGRERKILLCPGGLNGFGLAPGASGDCRSLRRRGLVLAAGNRQNRQQQCCRPSHKCIEMSHSMSCLIGLPGQYSEKFQNCHFFPLNFISSSR